jgi:hypothetical protein
MSDKQETKEPAASFRALPAKNEAFAQACDKADIPKAHMLEFLQDVGTQLLNLIFKEKK